MAQEGEEQPNKPSESTEWTTVKFGKRAGIAKYSTTKDTKGNNSTHKIPTQVKSSHATTCKSFELNTPPLSSRTYADDTKPKAEIEKPSA